MASLTGQGAGHFLPCALHRGAFGEGGALAANPCWHPRTSSMLLVPFLSPSLSSFPSLSSPAVLITYWGCSWNTLEGVDLAGAPVCGTRNALGGGTPSPWAALWRACICWDGRCPGLVESQSSGPDSTSVYLWDPRRSHLPAAIHGERSGPVDLRPSPGPSPAPPPPPPVR